MLYILVDYSTLIHLSALDLSPALPTTLGVLSKWSAESVRHIFLPSSTFIANMRGYPVLPKPTQQFIRDSMIASLSYPVQDIFLTIIYIAPASDYPFGSECWEPFSWRRSRIFTICSPSGKNQPGREGCSKCWHGRKFRTGISRLPSSSITGKMIFCGA